MKIRTLTAFLAALCVLCGVLPLTAAAADVTLTTSYDAAKSIYGGAIDAINDHRNAGYVVKYTYGFDAAVDCPSDSTDMIGSTTTKDWYETGVYTGANYTCANQWGVEVSVNAYGYVTAVEKGVGNMAIPEDGYVLSAVNDSGNEDTTLNTYEANDLYANVQVGDVIVASDTDYYIYRVTDDDKLLGDNVTFNIPYTKLSGSYAASVTLGGNGVATGTNYWQNYLLVKQTGTTDAGLPTGYSVRMINAETAIPEGYFAVNLPGQTVSDAGKPGYNPAMLIKEYACAGAVVTCGSNELFFRYDAQSAVRAAHLLTGATNDTVTAEYDFSAKMIYTDALTNFELVNTDRMAKLYNNMVAITQTINSSMTVAELKPYMATLYQNYDELCTLEYEVRTVEMRATWMRPLPNDGKERTEAELDALLTDSIVSIKEQGYNMIFIEAFYNSTTVFPVPETVGYNGLSFNQNPYLVPVSAGGLNSNLTETYDMLQRFIEICEENDMEPHIWWEIFYVGYQRTNGMTDSLFDYSVAKVIKEDTTGTYTNWLNTASNGDLYYGAETDGALQYFLNPASDGARTFLMNTFEYVWANYDVKSFQLDYIRYPHTNAAKCFGYDEDTLWRFTQSDYYDASVHTTEYLKTYAGFYDEAWVQFRADFVTSFVEEIRTNMGRIAPAMYLTASPGAEPEESKANLMQDVTYWLQNDLIDIIFPMAYGENVPGLVSAGLVADNSEHFVCTGVSGSYLDNDMEARWMKEIRDAGADGLAAFGEIPDYADYVWSKAAVTPIGNAAKAVRIYLADTVSARAAQMLKLGAIDDATLTAVNAATAQADDAIRFYGIRSDEALSAINALQAIADTLADAPKAAMTKDVNYLLKIRNNARDDLAQATDAAKSDATLTVNGTKVINGGEGFSYVAATETLYVSQNGAVLSGDMPENITLVLADGVNTLELNNVTFASNGTSIEAAAALTIDLTGKSTLGGDTLASVTCTYIGTGELYNGDMLVMCKGDIDGSADLDTNDLRDMLQYNVKAVELTAEQVLVGDADGNGKVNTVDTRIFLAKLLGKL